MAKDGAKAYDPKKIHQLSIDEIQPDPSNPRKGIDEGDLEGLTENIQKVGVKYPIIFRQDGEKVVIVDGERRYRAAKAAGLKTIPGILDSKDPEETAIITNLHRRDYTAVAEAEALLSLKDKFSYTDENLKGIVKKARSTISDILLINNLPGKIKDVCRGSYNYSQRRLISIARIKDAKEQAKKFEELRKVTAKEKKRDRAKKPEAANKSIKSFSDRLEKIKAEWQLPEKWEKKEKNSVRKELEILKAKIEELLDLDLTKE
jgi:ParB family chromosome partitioning protein